METLKMSFFWMKRIVINEALQAKRKQSKIVLNNYTDNHFLYDKR